MIVYTDGSFSRKPKIAGYGAVIITKDGKQYKIGGHTNKCENNNTAEVYAIASALKFIVNNKLMKDDNNVCVVMTDSTYAINHLDSLNGNSFEERCYDYIREFRCRYQTKFFWIKGHVHDGTKVSYFNNICDQIACDERYIGLCEYNSRNAHKIINKKRHSR